MFVSFEDSERTADKIDCDDLIVWRVCVYQGVIRWTHCISRLRGLASNLHPLELDLALDVSGEVGLDVGEVGDLVDVRRGSDEVGALDEFQAGFLEADAG